MVKECGAVFKHSSCKRHLYKQTGTALNLVLSIRELVNCSCQILDIFNEQWIVSFKIAHQIYTEDRYVLITPTPPQSLCSKTIGSELHVHVFSWIKNECVDSNLYIHVYAYTKYLPDMSVHYAILRFSIQCFYNPFVHKICGPNFVSFDSDKLFSSLML